MFSVQICLVYHHVPIWVVVKREKSHYESTWMWRRTISISASLSDQNSCFQPLLQVLTIIWNQTDFLFFIWKTEIHLNQQTHIPEAPDCCRQTSLSSVPSPLPLNHSEKNGRWENMRASARKGCPRCMVSTVQLWLWWQLPRAPPCKLSPCSHSCGRSVLEEARPVQHQKAEAASLTPSHGMDGGHRAQGQNRPGGKGRGMAGGWGP